MRCNYQKLRTFITKVMVCAGLEAEEADIFAENLLFADCRGIGSHGISRLGVYAKRAKSGVITAGANCTVIREAPSTLLLDANNGIGAKTARQAMDMTIAKAKETGCCVTAVRGGTHFGAAAFYSKYAAEKGMVAYVISNSDACVAPYGGKTPMLGTNPMAISVPAGTHEPFNLDMATSVVARGKIVLAKKEGKQVPMGYAVDKDGNNSTDPDAILDGGCLLPFGTYKGYGISLFMDMILTSLSGSGNCRSVGSFWDDFENPQNLGYMMVVFDPTKFLPFGEFISRVDAVLDEFQNAPAAEGVERVIIPGEPETAKEKESQELGVPVSDAVVKELHEIAALYGVEADFI